ncbi:MAG: Txe/YoeB family addiction module toxin [Geovibrio sp.]|jgi:toxin YoeB|uniref:Txe/YoeB family addiction module toxin n=1 Tax=Geovibrio ferrireducens TaxID=46201 RepID=UPI0022459C40|nr:Txe/YoeB family addiction module toxin [Geovibrio ferrireducens]MCD8569568.1 Txe/YoeB family addiction module toxin [Geovibrio sp.]
MIIWTETAWEDYLYWQQNDRKVLKRINELVKDIRRNPFDGLGKPEALKFSLAGKWSRRIDHEHRLVYQIDNSHIVIFQCRYHY